MIQMTGSELQTRPGGFNCFEKADLEDFGFIVNTTWEMIIINLFYAVTVIADQSQLHVLL